MRRKNSFTFGTNIVLVVALLVGSFVLSPVDSARAATLTVMNTNDSGSGSLRQAIADSASGDMITFDPSLAGQTIILTSNLVISKDLTIDGSGLSPQITINGGNVAHLEATGVNAPSVTISDLIISNGYSSGDGGAIYSGSTGMLTVINSTLKNSHSLETGGAIYAFQLTLQNTTIHNNQASGGGAIFLVGNGSATIVNSTIVQNQATYEGGAIFMLGNGWIDVFNSTFAENSADSGKEVSLHGNINMFLYNTIFACAPPDNVNCYVTTGNVLLTGDHSILNVGTLSEFGLTELADNGGPTQTMALILDSPLINAGSDAVCADAHINNLDQRGIVRPQGDHCDIGAYEIGELIVTKTVDTDDGICDLDCSLREAIADATSGAIITFDPSLAGGVLSLFSQLTINKNLTIDGSMLNLPLTLSGGPTSRIIQADWPAHVTISGLILTNGNATSGNGGAVQASSFTAINSTFVNNSAGGSGGAISGGTIKVINSTFSRNIAGGDGGAIIGVNLDISNTTISENQANQAGGAIAIYGDGTTTITNSTIFQNQAGSSGGGMFITGFPIVDILNSTFAENTAVNGREFLLGTIYHIAFANTIFVCTATSESCYVPAGNTILNTNSILGVGSLNDYGLSEPADHGGPTETMAFLPHSPLIDAGDDSICANAPVNSLDQRGVSRPQGSHCDIGAYEDQFIVRYVNQDATGTDDGSSWTNAHTDLQSALAATSPDEEIWVAAGTYKPTSTNDRTISFNLKNGVAVYGGFTGAETSRNQRDYEANLTRLSGDIGVVDDNSDNSYHVVVGSNTNNSALLDGFTITDGNANVHPHTSGGGMYNSLGSPSVTNVIFSDNYATFGGGMYNVGNNFFPTGSNPILTNVTFSNNSAVEGGGMRNENYSSPILTNVTFSTNSVVRSGGGMENFFHSDPILINVTFNGNTAGAGGGGILNWSSSSPTLTNVTFSGNSATDWGGGIYNDNGSNPTLTNVTMNSNEANEGGGIYNAYGSEPTITNSIIYGNPGGEIFDVSGTRVITYSIVQGGYPGAGNLDADPLLSALQDNGGFTQTMALQNDSPAIDSGNDATCTAADQRGISRPQGSHCDIGAYEFEPTSAKVDVKVAGTTVGNDIEIPLGSGQRVGFAMDNGPVQIMSMNNVDILPALRVIWKEPGTRTSYSEMMGLPAEQLSTEYWFPWYNNLDVASMEQGFRIANVDAVDTTIKVMLGTTELDSFSLAAGTSVRTAYDVNDGPIQIYSVEGHNILTALRVIWKEPGSRYSYSEMMGLPAEQLSTEYWFPWYNNLDTASIEQGFRIAMVNGSGDNTIEVRVAGALHQSFTLAQGASVRASYPVNDGPVQIVCTTCTGAEKIITSLRVIWKEPGFRTSYSEMMGLPLEQLSTTYWFPWYNNADVTSMQQGFRIAIVNGSGDNTVQVWVAGMMQDSFTLPAGDSVRVGYNANNGPARIICTTCTLNEKIVTSLRVIWKEPGFRTSYSEMMGLPAEQLSTEYWFPWYNNAVPTAMEQGFRISVP